VVESRIGPLARLRINAGCETPIMTETRGSLYSSAASAPPRPRSSPLKAHDPVFLVVLNVAVVTYMWFRHDGLGRSVDLGEWLVSIGQLTGLYAALAVLLGLVLISRAPWLERRYGMDQMMRAHRLVGFTAKRGASAFAFRRIPTRSGQCSPSTMRLLLPRVLTSEASTFGDPNQTRALFSERPLLVRISVPQMPLRRRSSPIKGSHSSG